MPTAEEAAVACEKWLMQEFPCRNTYADEKELLTHLLRELRQWLATNLPECALGDTRGRTYLELHGHRYHADLELSCNGQWRIPVEVKLVRDGREIAQAIGQAVVYSLENETAGAIVLAVAVEGARDKLVATQDPVLSEALWRRHRVRLCVRSSESLLEWFERLLPTFAPNELKVLQQAVQYRLKITQEKPSS